MAKQQTASRSKARPKDNGSEKGKSGSGDKASSYEQELAELLQERIKPNLNRGSIPLLARSLAKDIAARQRSDEEEADDEPTDESEAGDESKAEADEAPESDDEPEAEADDEPEAEAEADEDEEPEAEADEDEEPEAEADEDEEPEDDEDEDEEPEAEAEEDESDDEEEGEAEGEDPVSVFEEEMHQLQEDLGDEWIVRFSVQNDEAWLTAEKEDGSQHVEGPTADVLREAVELLEGGDESD